MPPFPLASLTTWTLRPEGPWRLMLEGLSNLKAAGDPMNTLLRRISPRLQVRFLAAYWIAIRTSARPVKAKLNSNSTQCPSRRASLSTRRRPKERPRCRPQCFTITTDRLPYRLLILRTWAARPLLGNCGQIRYTSSVVAIFIVHIKI